MMYSPENPPPAPDLGLTGALTAALPNADANAATLLPDPVRPQPLRLADRPRLYCRGRKAAARGTGAQAWRPGGVRTDAGA